jgi:hypothetical protein
MAVMHRLTGYDPETDAQKFALRIPPERFPAVRALIGFDEGAPQVFEAYELNYSQAREIAGMLSHPDPPRDLAYCLEAFANGR